MNVLYTVECFLHHRPLTSIRSVVLKHLHLQCPGRGESRWWSWRVGLMPRALAPCLGSQFCGCPRRRQGARSSLGTSLGECLLQIQDIVRRRQLLTIFREGKDGQQDVDVAILQALLKGEGLAKWGPREKPEQGCSGPRLLVGQTCWSQGGWPVGAHWRCWSTGVFLNLPF